MATEKWGPKFPKFNSSQMKLELSEFSAQLQPFFVLLEKEVLKIFNFL